jgi:hypothetical protein
MRKSVLLCAAALCSLVSCGVFDPRPVEYPANTVTVDPFGFASILWGTGKQITKVDYNDIFYDAATFVDIDDNRFDKRLLVDHLIALPRRFVIDAVTWSADTIHDFTIGDTFFVDRAYHVAARDTVIIPQKSYEFDDYASFKLVFDADKNTWSIFYWKDKYPGKSIFHPRFQPEY